MIDNEEIVHAIYASLELGALRAPKEVQFVFIYNCSLFMQGFCGNVVEFLEFQFGVERI